MQTLLLTLALLAVPCWAQAANDDAPTLEQGLLALQAGDVATAISTLNAVTAAEPENGRAWALLGYALHSQGRLDEALPCHERAAALPESAGLGAYNAGLAWALKGDADQAFRWLTQARDQGGMDLSGLATDADAASLRGDARWAQLMPGAPNWDRPFAEDVTVLHEWNGEQPGSEFGWIARDLGDVDGDGVHDVITSAPSLSAGGPYAGRVSAFSGKSGARLWSVTGKPGQRLGLGIEGAGDVNADGIPDAIGGAPGTDTASVWSGRDGTLLLTLASTQPGAMFGNSTAGLGDVNGDGHDDVLVGAWQHASRARSGGQVTLFSGKDGSVLSRITGVITDETFGFDTTGIGDVNGDGLPDLLVSSAWSAKGGPKTGRMFVLAGPGR